MVHNVLLLGFNTTIFITLSICCSLILKALVATIDAQWEGMGDVGSARYEPALLPPCLTIRVLSYSIVSSKFSEIQDFKG